MVSVQRWLEVVLAATLLTCGVAELIRVGGRYGWADNVNYTVWAANQTFYVGDWLNFVFDKRNYNVLEVNKSSYDNCIDTGFIKNITKGGRDVFNLTDARPYYFLSSGGYCYHGMKLAIDVKKPVLSPSQSASPVKKNLASSRTGDNRLVFFVLFFAASVFYSVSLRHVLIDCN